MTTEERRVSLALWAVGAVFIFGVWPLIVIWPSGRGGVSCLQERDVAG